MAWPLTVLYYMCPPLIILLYTCPRYSHQSGRRPRAGLGCHDRELHRMAPALPPHGSTLSSHPHCFPLLRKRTYTRGSRAPAGTQFTCFPSRKSADADTSGEASISGRYTRRNVPKRMALQPKKKKRMTQTARIRLLLLV